MAGSARGRRLSPAAACLARPPQATTSNDIYMLPSAATAGSNSTATAPFSSSGQMRQVNLIVTDGTALFTAKTGSATTSGVWESCV